jgi:hypothetical protein
MFRTAIRICLALPLVLYNFSTLGQIPSPAPSPSPSSPAVPASAPPPEPAPPSTTQITGTILDDQGVPVSGATVTLLPFGKVGERTATTLTSAANGTFSFSGLLPDQYRMDVAAQGFSLYSSGEFTLHPGTSLTLPAIQLKVSTTTNVNVVATQDQVAVAEIHMQEQQRVFGVFQNFYTSYIWDAAPMPARQKYKLALRALVDVPGFVIIAGVAGAEQYNGTYPGYGPGIEGYGKRYGAALCRRLHQPHRRLSHPAIPASPGSPLLLPGLGQHSLPHPARRILHLHRPRRQRPQPA